MRPIDMCPIDMCPIDILILSNGPGEVATWVRPVVQAMRQQMGKDSAQVRISLVLSPCPNATGREVAIAQSFRGIDRIQAAPNFFPFLLWGQTQDHQTQAWWDWRDRGVVVFLGGDQLFPILIGKRLGYRIVIYGEWETRWHKWGDRFAVMRSELAARAHPKQAKKFTVIGDLMADVGDEDATPAGDCDPTDQLPVLCPLPADAPLIGLLPGSKPAKLAQGVPLCLAIAQHLAQIRPDLRFGIPIAPTLDLPTLAKFADPTQNPMAHHFGGVGAVLVETSQGAILRLEHGLEIPLWTTFPAYNRLRQCAFCLTTVGANTAELGALAIPMIVLLPTQQLDAMRAWDGLPGLFANLPGFGSLFAKLINAWFLRQPRRLAWPNIWAGRSIVPELIGNLQPQAVATLALDWLTHPEKLAEIRSQLRQVRGQPGAAHKLVAIIQAEVNQSF